MYIGYLVHDNVEVVASWSRPCCVGLGKRRAMPPKIQNTFSPTRGVHFYLGTLTGMGYLLSFSGSCMRLSPYESVSPPPPPPPNPLICLVGDGADGQSEPWISRNTSEVGLEGDVGSL